MKSIYQDKTFAEYWNKRAWDSGEAYKLHVIDPIMFELIGNLDNKTVLELGCGNWYLSKNFIQKWVKSLILADISKYNLANAKQKCNSEKIEYIQQDVTKKFKIESNSIDIVYSNMLLNEIEDIHTPISESYRILKKWAIFIFSVTHPSWDLYIFAQEKAWIKSKKIKGLGNYFRKGFAKYIMGGDNKNNPNLAEKFKNKFEVEHYQRPLSDYFNTLTKAGFNVKNIIEPEPNKELLKNFPRFSEYSDYPIWLIFYCIK